MLTLRDGIVELYKKVATSLPKDVEEALKTAHARETDPQAQEALGAILRRIIEARTTAILLCEDTGFPVFFVKVPRGLSHQHIREVIVESTRIATAKIPLRPNAVDIVTGENSGSNVGEYFPMIYIDEVDGQSLTIDLMLRGGSCENLGQTYVLREHDLSTVKQCIINAVTAAKGKACPPYVLGVAVGGSRDQVAFLSKKQLLRRLHDTNPHEAIARIETDMMQEINRLSEVTSDFIYKTAIMGVKVCTAHHHPDSLLVDVSFSCWAHRRGRLIW